MNTVTVTKGRKPISAKPMTQAERKARQRQMEQRAVTEAIGKEDQASFRSLLALLAKAERNEDAEHAAHRAWKEIGKRFDW